ncbi:ADAM 17-like protease [Armadillidium nasatum]|uniref:ADAM 17-like protease n=1 Tax=Armadillidium nasatum TaxID=96803 RepID=A0A5N5T2D0_9CRUS|nr:ADAM 17-like protease [Armadillidium nasatum]
MTYDYSTVNYLISLIDRVDKIYENTVWRDASDNGGFSGMGFVIKKILVHQKWTPVASNQVHYNMERDSWDVRNLLEVFSREYSHKDYCLAHLFTDIKFEAVFWGLLTPECSPSASQGGSYLMYTYSVSGYDINNKRFSPCSLRAIRAVLVAKSSRCFTEPEESYCGNQRVEGQEECDAGLVGQDDIDMNSPCCQNCHYMEEGKVCREEQPATCELVSRCTGREAECPKPRPMRDGTPCIEKGQCMDEDININTVLMFLRDNIVGTVIIISMLIWVPASCVFSYVDRRLEAEYRKYVKWHYSSELVHPSDNVRVIVSKRTRVREPCRNQETSTANNSIGVGAVGGRPSHEGGPRSLDVRERPDGAESRQSLESSQCQPGSQQHYSTSLPNGITATYQNQKEKNFKKPIAPSDILWNFNERAVSVIKESYEMLNEVFDTILEEWNNDYDAIVLAKSLKYTLLEFSYFLTLHI